MVGQAAVYARLVDPTNPETTLGAIAYPDPILPDQSKQL